MTLCINTYVLKERDLGIQLCKALGIDTARVTRLSIEADARGATITVESREFSEVIGPRFAEVLRSVDLTKAEAAG